MRSRKNQFGVALASLCVLVGALVPGGSGCGRLETEDPFVVPLAELAPGEEVVPNQYIFFYRDDVTEADVTGTERQLASVQGAKRHDYASLFKGFSAEVQPKGLDEMRRNPALAYIQRNGIIHATSAGMQSCPPWNLDVIDQATSIVPNDMYAYAHSGKDVHVYILDSGIDANHVQFGTRVDNGQCTIPNPADPMLPKPCLTLDDWNDCQGHGTHLAGIVGGQKVGVAKEVTLHAVRVLDCEGKCDMPTGTDDSYAKGLDWVKNQKVNGKRVVLLGFSRSVGGWHGLYDRINELASKEGIVVVAPAGNDGKNACDYMPGGKAPLGTVDRTVITVGAFGEFGQGLAGSNHGACVDVLAPGIDVLSLTAATPCSGNPVPAKGTTLGTGTSQAAAHVAGVAALLLERGLPPTEVRAAIIGGAQKDKLGNLPGGTPNLALRSPLENAALVSPPLKDMNIDDADGCVDGATCTSGVCSICSTGTTVCNGVATGGGIDCDEEGVCDFCGADGLKCCPGSTPFCADELECSGGVCHGQCGFPPKPDGSTYPCCNGVCFGAGVTCNDMNECVLCGTENEGCCGNTCLNDALTCEAGACKKCGFAPVGNVTYPCCDGVCFGDLVCNGSNQCEPPVSCGAQDQLCCANDSCATGLQCVSGQCQASPPCGTVGQTCCTGNLCNAALYCGSNNTCASCGGNGDTCCPFPSGACQGDMICNGSNQCESPVSCGAQDQLCCANDSCATGLQCVNGQCQASAPCGAHGQTCCAANTCNAGLYCVPPTPETPLSQCAPCGEYGEPCCPFPSTPCNGDMACNYDPAGDSGTCESECHVRCKSGKIGYPASSYKFVTQYDCFAWGSEMCADEGWISQAFFNHVPIVYLLNCGGQNEACCDGVPNCSGSLTCTGDTTFMEDNSPLGYFRHKHNCQ